MRHSLYGLKAILLTALALLAGCEAPQISHSDPSKPFGSSPSRSFEPGDSFEAPEVLIMRARAHSSPEKETYLLRAVEAYYSLGRIESGDALLTDIQPSLSMPRDVKAKWVLLMGNMYTRQKDWNTLERLIIDDEFNTISEMALLKPELQIALTELRAQFYEGTSRHQYAIQERIYLHSSLDPKDQQYNSDKIWANVLRLPNPVLQDPRYAPPAQGTEAGWIQLTQAIRQHPTSITGQQQAIRAWMNRWPQHPARSLPPSSLAALLQFQPSQTRKIAALLPQSGRYQPLSHAIQKGIMTSYYASQTPMASKPEITFYDTSQATDINSLYDAAIAQGADFVIGPLDKNNVAALSKRPDFPVPTLALNYADIGADSDDTQAAPANFYQFGLRAEDEIRQMADYAQSRGYKRAILLTPKGAWGERIAGYFESYWAENEGVLLGSHSYEKGPNIGQTIQKLLDIPASRNRYWRMKVVSEQEISHRLRRRQDVDVIFAIATPSNGRLIKPQLEYFFASDVPMLSTSHIYDGQLSSKQIRDMNGVLFCEMPWMIGSDSLERTAFQDQWPKLGGDQQQLAAMGVDAYKLHPIIQALDLSPNLELKGETGTLYVENNREITRRLPLFMFRNGRAFGFDGLQLNTSDPANQ